MDEKYIWWLHKKFYIMQKQLESQSESQVCSPLFSNTAWTPLGKLSCSRLKKDEFVPLLRWDSLTCMRTSLVDCILFCSLVSGPFTTSFLSSSCGVWHNSAYSHCFPSLRPVDSHLTIYTLCDQTLANRRWNNWTPSLRSLVQSLLIYFLLLLTHLALRLSPFGPVSSNLQRASGTACLHVESLCLFGNHLFCAKTLLIIK